MARQQGTPTWIDYSSDGLAPSLEFYARLAGWSFEDLGEEMGHYRIARSESGSVAGLMDSAGMTCPEGGDIPPAWDVHLAVDSVDETCARARGAGAEVVVGPRDVPGQGRMAMLVDPTGCAVSIWEDRGFEGSVFTGRPGTPVWFEIMSMDVEATRRFYSEVFGLQYVAQSDDAVDGSDGAGAGEPDEMPGYWTAGAPESASSGLCDASSWFPEGTRSFWRWYLAVASTDESLRVVEELGGKALDGPVDSPFGRVTTIQDPAGASLQIVEVPADEEGAR